MRRVEIEAEGNNERTVIPGRVREKHEIREKCERVKEEGKASQLSTRCLHQGAE